MDRVRKARMWGRWALAGLLATTFAWASPGSVRQQVESSLLVEGSIDIEPNGSVSALAINQEDKLPEIVRGVVRTSALQWKFEPVLVDGKAVRARAPMSARLVAKQMDDGNYQVGIRSVNFEAYESSDPAQIAFIDLKPPRYPRNALHDGVQGDVYLVVRVGRDGRVQEAVAEQVNLTVRATELEMRLFRQVLAKGALDRARDWRFRVPSAGEHAADPYWTVRVPVTFRITEHNAPAQSTYGHWETYIPGPRNGIPWEPTVERTGFSPDTLVDGGVYMVGIDHGPKLLTPLQGG